MTHKYTFQDVILSFSASNTPSPADAFAVLAKVLKTTPESVSNWYYRDRIPPQHWEAVLRASHKTQDTEWIALDFVLIAARYE